jgi:hypothetical protein
VHPRAPFRRVAEAPIHGGGPHDDRETIAASHDPAHKLSLSVGRQNRDENEKNGGGEKQGHIVRAKALAFPMVTLSGHAGATVALVFDKAVAIKNAVK